MRSRFWDMLGHYCVDTETGLIAAEGKFLEFRPGCWVSVRIMR